MTRYRQHFTQFFGMLLLIITAIPTWSDAFFETDVQGNVNQRNIGVMQSQHLDRPAHQTNRLEKQVRQLPPYSRIDVRIPVDLTFQGMQAYRAEIEASPATLQALRMEVSGGTLVISGQTTHFEATPRIALAGSRLEEARIRSAGDFRFAQVHGKHFSLLMRGAANVQVSGKQSVCRIDSQGAGDIDQSELICERVALKVFGANDLSVHATREISGRLQGAGDLTVLGNPPKRELAVQGAFDVAYF